VTASRRSDTGVRAIRALQALAPWPPPYDYEDPFLPSIDGRAFLPADYWLTESQFDAVRRVTTRRGGVGFLRQSALREESGELVDGCCEVVWAEPETWSRGLEPALECFMVDLGAEWGVAFSTEEFAIVGGRRDFVSDLMRVLGASSSELLAEWLQAGRAGREFYRGFLESMEWSS